MERKYLTEDAEKFHHLTKDGRYIPLDKLDDTHLCNILKFYKRKAKKGIKVYHASGNFTSDDMFYDDDTLYGEKALQELNYYAYEEEANLRWGNKNVS